MEVQLKIKIKVEGYSALHGIDHSRISLKGMEVCTNLGSLTTDAIREKYGAFYCQYRLVKEPNGYIFREVIHDTGISGHHKTIKQAIYRSLGFGYKLFIDEPFDYSEFEGFKKLEAQHKARANCKHSFTQKPYDIIECSICGHYKRSEDKS